MPGPAPPADPVPVGDGDPWTPLREGALGAVLVSMRSLGWGGPEDEVRSAFGPGPEGRADLALPVFRWAKPLKRSPDELAKAVSQGVHLPAGFARVEAEKGFVNFHVDPRSFAASTLGLALGRGAAYGRGPKRPGRVCVEHTSANPTGQLHVGRSRNAVIGDTYARVLRAAGWEVVTQFYVDDAGRQAALLVWLWSKPTSAWPPEVLERSGVPKDGVRPPETKLDEWYGRPYPAASEHLKSHPEAGQELAELSRHLESGKFDPTRYREVPQQILDGILQSLKRIGSTYDEFVWESDFILDGSVDALLEKFRSSPRYRKEPDGAEGADGRDLGLPEDHPLVFFTRKDGLSLYPARDVAYHLQKFSRFDRVIDVLGTDHQMHVRGLLTLLDAAEERRRPEVVIYEFVNLPEGRMSTRGGRVVNLDDALDEAVERAKVEVRKRREDLSPEAVAAVAESVGCGALRFHILKVQPEKPIVFRWEEALSFEGKSAPFVQYAHARAASLLRRSAGGDERELPTVPAPAEEAVPSSLDPREVSLLRCVSQLPGLIDRVAQSGSVHLLAVYAHELAERFNEFYQGVRVLDGAPEVRAFRLALVAATRQTLANTLDLCGVDALMRM